MNIRAKKSFGQHFLTDQHVVRKIVEAAEIVPRQWILEIGPGTGVLTRALVDAGANVAAVEADHDLIHPLREQFENKIILFEGDILGSAGKAAEKFLQDQKMPFQVVANIPYNITSPILEHFFRETPYPFRLVLMVQKEVSQRICAKPPKMSLLAVAVQFYATPSIISYVKKNCFWPQPKVDSAILKIIPHKQNLGSLSYPNTNPHLREPKFFEVVKAGFKQPRKQLGNNLASGLKLSRQQVETWLTQAGIQPAQRAETLSVQDWLKLSLTKVGIT